MNIADEIKKGSLRAIGRMIRILEDDPISALGDMKKLYPDTGKAYLIGLTGSPGVGKSSLTDKLITIFREKGLKVGVVAIDPTSPFSGGAILGDRVRMQKHATDDGVFIRSLATRGAFGGLTPAAKGAVHILDAAGYDVILIETVGVGQDEVDIVKLAHTTLVITVPGLGDGVQAIKAGIMEIADILVVNKADRENTDATVRELEAMLDLNKMSGQKRLWWPKVKPVSAQSGKGIDELMEEISRHRDFITRDNPSFLKDKIRAMSKELVYDLIRERVWNRLEEAIANRADWTERLDATVTRSEDPYTLAEDIYKEEFV